MTPEERLRDACQAAAQTIGQQDADRLAARLAHQASRDQARRSRRPAGPRRRLRARVLAPVAAAAAVLAIGGLSVGFRYDAAPGPAAPGPAPSRVLTSQAAAPVSASASPSAAPATPVPASHPVVPPSAPRCTDSQITVTLTHGGAAGGEEGGYVKFTNKSPASCTLTGWPAVTAVSQAGTATAVTHGRSLMLAGSWTLRYPLPVVTVQPGSAAWVVIAGQDTPAVPPLTGCPVDTRLRVTIPGGTQVRTLSAWIAANAHYLPACPDAAGHPIVQMTDIVPGSALPR